MADVIITPELARIRDIQNAMLEAIKRVVRVPQHAADQAREDECRKRDELAVSLGVDPEEYRRWTAGENLPHIKEAVLKAAK